MGLRRGGGPRLLQQKKENIHFISIGCEIDRGRFDRNSALTAACDSAIFGTGCRLFTLVKGTIGG